MSVQDPMINNINMNIDASNLDNNNDDTSKNNDNNANNVKSNSNDTKVKRKRNRIPLSCTICRKRKVKCDKTRPHCNQCTKTGVAHLCHYMEQSWAEEAERELSKDAELKKLRERVKYLERALNKLHSNSNTPENNNINNNNNNNNDDNNNIKDITESDFHPNENINNPNNNANENNIDIDTNLTNNNNNIHPNKDSSTDSSNSTTVKKEEIETITLAKKDKYDNDELDLTKQFDMLHIKNNGTIHLGATHWLAIMKGDPYLKLLWGHIFNIREKVNEWYSQRLILSKNNKHKRHLPMSSQNKNLNELSKLSNVQNAKNSYYQNIAPHPIPPSTDGSIRRCPVTGQIAGDEPPMANSSHHTNNNDKEPPPQTPDSAEQENRSNADNDNDNQSLVAPHPIPISTDGTIRRCPVTGKTSNDSDSTNNLPPAPHPIPPQGDIRKCPVAHLITDKKANTIANSHNKPAIHNKSKKPDYAAMTNDEIIKKVTRLLPPRHIIFQFINKFFKHIYPVIPIIDEQNFKNHLEEILVSKVDTSTIDPAPLKIRVSKPSDYCHLGIMIIIIRLTWLSLPSNRSELKLGVFESAVANSPASPSSVSSSSSSTSASIKEDNILSTYETSSECLELVKDYLIKFDKISSISNNNINLTTIQFAVFYKMYMSNAPTEGFISQKNNSIHSISDSNAHDNESNQILLSSIIQMAFSCGLHRDPDNFPQLNVVSTYHKKESGTALGDTTHATHATTETDPTNNSDSKVKENQVATERFKHTWRKIWYYIVHLDVEQSLALGSPRLLRNLKDFSDTKLPSSSKIDYVRDIKELIIIKNFTLFWQIDLIIIAVLNHILNVFLAKNVRKFELDALIKSLTDLTYGRKNINDVINDLINKNLLSTSEGSVSYQDYSDEKYNLPTLEEILSREALSAPSSTVNTPMSSHDSAATPMPEKKFELPHEATTKAIFFKKHLTLRMILYLLNYILFTHYEPLGSQDSGTISITKQYAQETLNFALDGYRNCLIFFNNVKKTPHSISTIFDYVNILLSPGCLDIGHRALQFLVCLTLRAKCGPIGGINQNLFTNSGDEESDRDSTNGDSQNNLPMKLGNNLSSINPNVINDINLEAVTDSQLSENLIVRMKLFEELTAQIAVKYPYASRTSRSTGFFITLLSGSSSKKNAASFGTTGWKHPNISGFFKNVPSLVMSGDNDQLSRCPVFQDALGFMTPKAPNSNPQSTQLPPIKSSYKPITYTNSNIRKREIEKENKEEKRRKLESNARANATGSITSNKQNSNIIPPLPIMNSVNTLIDTMTLPNTFGSTSNTPAPSNNVNYNYHQGTINVPTYGGNTPMSQGNAMMRPQSVPIQDQRPSPYGYGPTGTPNRGGTPLSVPLTRMQSNNSNKQGMNGMGSSNNSINNINNNTIPNGFPSFNANNFNNILVQDSIMNDLGGNSNMNELFDPTNVMQAITQFNPLLEMNNMSNPNMGDYGIANNLAANNNSGYNNGGSMNGGMMAGNYGHHANSIASVASNSSINNMTLSSSASNTPSMQPGNLEANNFDVDFFIPKIEDGFTELQDFTIWD